MIDSGDAMIDPVRAVRGVRTLARWLALGMVLVAMSLGCGDDGTAHEPARAPDAGHRFVVGDEAEKPAVEPEAAQERAETVPSTADRESASAVDMAAPTSSSSPPAHPR